MTDFDSSLIAAIQKLTAAMGFAPTLRELMIEVDSPSFKKVHSSLSRLRDAGIVDWQDKSSRTLRVVSDADSESTSADDVCIGQATA